MIHVGLSGRQGAVRNSFIDRHGLSTVSFPSEFGLSPHYYVYLLCYIFKWISCALDD